jgi:hypothetical protein
MKSIVARNIKQMNKIASGPGALKVPSSVSSIKLQFSPKNLEARHFWKQVLPQIQFHNPELPIAVQRFDESSKDLKQALILTLGKQIRDFSFLVPS